MQVYTEIYGIYRRHIYTHRQGYTDKTEIHGQDILGYARMYGYTGTCVIYARICGQDILGNTVIYGQDVWRYIGRTYEDIQSYTGLYGNIWTSNMQIYEDV